MAARGRKQEHIRTIETTDDFFGQKIRAGDLIVNCTNAGRSAVLSVSRIIEVREHHVDSYEHGRWTKVWEPCLYVEKSDGKKATINYTDRVVKAPDGWQCTMFNVK